MSARNIVGGVAGLAVSAMKLPFTTAEKVLTHGMGAAVGAAATGTAIAGAAARTAAGAVRPVVWPAGRAADRTAAKAAEMTGSALVMTADVTGSAAAMSAEVTGAVAAKTAEATGKAAAKTAEATGSAAAKTAEATGSAAAKTAEATGSAAAKTAEATGSGAAKTAQRAGTTGGKAADKAADKAGKTAGKAAGKTAGKAKKAAAEAAPEAAKDVPAGPRLVTAADLPLPPNLPLEPPVAIVEQAIAGEGQEATGAGRTTEPKPSSREEGHGQAPLRPAEVEEIAEEVAETTATGAVGIETPVGTTGADVGRNPDTAEADLQQPGTDPIVDPATAKTVRSTSRTGRKAADPSKG